MDFNINGGPAKLPLVVVALSVSYAYSYLIGFISF